MHLMWKRIVLSYLAKHEEVAKEWQRFRVFYATSGQY